MKDTSGDRMDQLVTQPPLNQDVLRVVCFRQRFSIPILSNTLNIMMKLARRLKSHSYIVQKYRIVENVLHLQLASKGQAFKNLISAETDKGVRPVSPQTINEGVLSPR